MGLLGCTICWRASPFIVIAVALSHPGVTRTKIEPWDCFNPFLFIKNKWLLIYSEGFPALEKKRPDMFSEVHGAHPVDCDSPLQIVMVDWRPFLHWAVLREGVTALCR